MTIMTTMTNGVHKSTLCVRLFAFFGLVSKKGKHSQPKTI